MRTTTIALMSDRITSIPSEEFANLLSLGMFTDAEIAEWVRSKRLTAKEKILVTKAVGKLKGGAITGIIRTAMREMEGLPPVPGDEV